MIALTVGVEFCCADDFRYEVVWSHWTCPDGFALVSIPRTASECISYQLSYDMFKYSRGLAPASLANNLHSHHTIQSEFLMPWVARINRNRQFPVNFSPNMVRISSNTCTSCQPSIYNNVTIYKTSFPCQYREKAGFAGPWKPAMLRTRYTPARAGFAGNAYTPANEAADRTTWWRP